MEADRVATLEAQVAQRTAALHLLQQITEATNTASTAKTGLRQVMRLICAHNGWGFGQVWLPASDGSGDFMVSGMWHAPGGRGYQRFRRVSKQTRFGLGEPLVGRIVQTRQAEWIEDVRHFAAWQRGNPAELECVAVIGFPVLVDEQVAAVLEFATDRPLQRDKRFMEIVPTLSVQLGYMLRCKRVERTVAEAADRQRQALGRELHDGLGQQITALGLLAANLRRQLEAGQKPALDSAAQLQAVIAEAGAMVQRLIVGLPPLDLDGRSLDAALDELTHRYSERFGIPCTLHCPEPVDVADSFVATQLYLIVREALHNAVKHAKAKHIAVTVSPAPLLRFQVRDDGVGFTPATGVGGSGMTIMQYRARLVGAQWDIEAALGRGTCVTCTLGDEEEDGPA